MNLVEKMLALLLAAVATASISDVTPDIKSDSASSLRTTLTRFSRPRHHVSNPRGKEKARKLIKRAFVKSGLHVWSEYIDSLPSLRGENIVGMLKGRNTGTADDMTVIVGAHYDTTSRTKGVDDNGSGVTALLQVAKQIGKSGCRFKNTILFVAFDFEEDTAESEYEIPFGSEWFVRNLTKHLHHTGGTVKGALVLEMLANYNSSIGSQNFPRLLSYISPQAYNDVTLDGNRGNFLAVIGRKEADRALLESLKKHYKNDEDFKIHLVPIPLTGRPSKSHYFKHLQEFYRSDHYNFWENKVSFPAVMITDTSNFRAKMDKCYHRRCDNMRLIDKQDLEFLRRNTNAVIKATVELSQAETCRSKYDDRLKAGLLATSTKTATAKVDKSSTDASEMNSKESKIHKRNNILLANYSQALSHTTLTLLLTVIHCVLAPV